MVERFSFSPCHIIGDNHTRSSIYIICILYCQDTYIHLRGPNKGLVVIDLGPSILREIPGWSSMRLAVHRKSVPHPSDQQMQEKATIRH